MDHRPGFPLDQSFTLSLIDHGQNLSRDNRNITLIGLFDPGQSMEQIVKFLQENQIRTTQHPQQSEQRPHPHDRRLTSDPTERPRNENQHKNHPDPDPAHLEDKCDSVGGSIDDSKPIANERREQSEE
jgi:hypothetical protein